MEQVISLTEEAITAVTRIFDQEEKDKVSFGLRVSILGGGCSGLSYNIDFSELKDNDNILEYNGIKVLIDPKSAIYLNGTTIDYKDGLNGKGFIFKNPNADNTCGCGESFSV